jgi:hypothetical protein
MKKLLFWINPILLGLLLCSCGSGNSSSQAETESIIETPAEKDSIAAGDTLSQTQSAGEVNKLPIPGRDTTPRSASSNQAEVSTSTTAGKNALTQKSEKGKTPPREQKEAPRLGSPDSGQLDSIKKAKEQLKK